MQLVKTPHLASAANHFKAVTLLLLINCMLLLPMFQVFVFGPYLHAEKNLSYFVDSLHLSQV